MAEAKFGQATATATVASLGTLAPPYVLLQHVGDVRSVVYIGSSSVGPTNGWLLRPGDTVKIELQEDQDMYRVVDGPENVSVAIVYFEPEV